MERWIFGMFLAVAAGQDLKKKQVDIWVYLVFGILAFLVAAERKLGGTSEFCWNDHIGGISLGLLILGVGIISRGKIGIGDGLFFLISGLILKLPETMLLLCYGLLFCGLYSLGYLVWMRFQTVEMRKMQGQIVPFLPFLVLPGIWILTAGI